MSKTLKTFGRYALGVILMAVAGWEVGLGAGLAYVLLREQGGFKQGWRESAGAVWWTVTLTSEQAGRKMYEQRSRGDWSF